MFTTAHAAKWLPRDFIEASLTGGVYTLIAYAVMIVVFSCEVASYVRSTYSTNLMLARKGSDVLQINFDIDMHDIECRNLQVTVWSQDADEPLTTLTNDFWLRSIDAKGRTYGVAVRPDELPVEGEAAGDSEADGHKREMAQLIKEDGKDELDADWSGSHDGFKHSSFQHVIAAHDFTLINFFATWCSHCRQFAPAWKEIADKINGGNGKESQKFADRDGQNRGVRLIRINCVDFQDLCTEKGVDAYPMIRLYKADGSFALFEGKRNEAEIIRWIERTVKMKSYGWSGHHDAFERGCNVKGSFQVPRVPGHFELTAGGGDQNLNTRMTNVSHTIKHLSFSDAEDGRYHRRSWAGLPHEMLDHLSPLDGLPYSTNQYHEVWIHDIKVVGTISARGQTSYQFAHQHRLSRLPEDDVPQAQFHYDIEPFSIWVQREDKRWYDFLTSLLAILGGTFVTMRLLAGASRGVASAVMSTVAAPRQAGHSTLDSGRMD